MNIPDVEARLDSDNLHRTLSMIDPCNVENLVGNVIVGMKQLVKNSVIKFAKSILF